MKHFRFTNGLFLLCCFAIFSAGLNAQNAYISTTTPYSQNFDGIGTTEDAILPDGWKIEKQTHNANVLFGAYETALTHTEQIGGNNLANSAKNGIYNFGAGDAATAIDRAIGGMSTGRGTDEGNSTQYVNMFLKLTNNGDETIQYIELDYDVEKYRKGNNAAGFFIQLYYSNDGNAWNTLGENFYTFFPADNATEGYATVPGATVHVKAAFEYSLPAGDALYLAWHYSAGPGFSNANAAQALGIDNITVNGKNTPPPAEPVAEISTGTDYEQNFDAIGFELTSTLPDGWKIEKRLDAPRTLGAYETALNKTEQTGGNNMAANAKNGIYNFGAGDAATSTDRAIGGLSTGVENGTRCVNIYLKLANKGTETINTLNIIYDVEKYRQGDNDAGFLIQLYYSADGVEWTSAGDNFKTFFPDDNQTVGYPSTPGDVKQVSSSLYPSIAAGDYFYLAWNYSVAAGSDAQAAQALGIDNVKITAGATGLPLTPTRLEIAPKNAVLLLGRPQLPLKILSLNNSLIYNNDQASIFEQLTASANKATDWTMETYLGQSLQYHWETAANPKIFIRNQSWTHIILQEQSSKPRTNPNDFYESVRLWVEYIRANCPNPNVKIIVTMNWPFTDAADYASDMAQLQASYRRVEQDFGVSIAPVGLSYDRIRTLDGTAAKNALYTDNRHPSMQATYLSACVLYATIFNETPVGITYKPNDVSQADADRMQTHAWETYQAYDAVVNDFAGTVKYVCTVYDQLGQVMELPEIDNLQWSVDASGGTMNGHVFTGNQAGLYTITANDSENNLSAMATVKVVAATTTVTWIATTGDWNSAANWSTGNIPNGNDNVLIPANANITLSANGSAKTLTINKGASINLNGKTLTANAVKVEYPVADNTWYAVGFPFNVANIYDVDGTELKPYQATGQPDGHFWLREYDYDIPEPTSPFHPSIASFDAGKGYVMQFPEWFDGENITFISAASPNLSPSAPTLDANYKMYVNHTLNRLVLTEGSGRYYYKFGAQTVNKFERPTGGVANITPFEAYIAVENPAILKNSFGMEEATGLVQIAAEGNDPVVAERYYNLQGQLVGNVASRVGARLIAPLQSGIYIVKQTLQSGTERVVKQLIMNN